MNLAALLWLRLSLTADYLMGRMRNATVLLIWSAITEYGPAFSSSVTSVRSVAYAAFFRRM